MKKRLSRREMDVLNVLWDTDKPLKASEIMNDDLPLTTVHTTLKRMLERNMVEVVDFVQSGNVFGRCYRPLLRREDCERSWVSNASGDSRKNEVSRLVEALLDKKDGNVTLEELDRLEQIVREKRQRLTE